MSYSQVDRAMVLAEALPYIQKFYGKTVVIKYGGNAMISSDLRHAVISDIILLHLVGIRVVVVHGGGPEISSMLKKIGKEPRFVDGLRYTDEETMDIVQQVLCGKVNKDLVATLNRMGGRAIGLCGMDGGMFQARKLDEKYGLVGEITSLHPEPVEDCLEAGYIPVISTVAQGMDAETAYNINADTAAAKLAVALRAEKLILLTDVRGLLRDPKDEDTLIHVVQMSHPHQGGHRQRRHDPQGGLLRGGGALRRQAQPYPGRPHPPLHPDRDAVRQGHRHHAPQLRGPHTEKREPYE